MALISTPYIVQPAHNPIVFVDSSAQSMTVTFRYPNTGELTLTSIPINGEVRYNFEGIAKNLFNNLVVDRSFVSLDWRLISSVTVSGTNYYFMQSFKELYESLNMMEIFPEGQRLKPLLRITPSMEEGEGEELELDYQEKLSRNDWFFTNVAENPTNNGNGFTISNIPWTRVNNDKNRVALMTYGASSPWNETFVPSGNNALNLNRLTPIHNRDVQVMQNFQYNYEQYGMKGNDSGVGSGAGLNAFPRYYGTAKRLDGCVFGFYGVRVYNVTQGGIEVTNLFNTTSTGSGKLAISQELYTQGGDQAQSGQTNRTRSQSYSGSENVETLRNYWTQDGSLNCFGVGWDAGTPLPGEYLRVYMSFGIITNGTEMAISGNYSDWYDPMNVNSACNSFGFRTNVNDTSFTNRNIIYMNIRGTDIGQSGDVFRVTFEKIGVYPTACGNIDGRFYDYFNDYKGSLEELAADQEPLIQYTYKFNKYRGFPAKLAILKHPVSSVSVAKGGKSTKVGNSNTAEQDPPVFVVNWDENDFNECVINGATFIRPVESCVPDNPFYVRWINDLGGYSQFMFTRNTQEERKVSKVKYIKRYLSSWNDDELRDSVEVYNFEKERSFTCGTGIVEKEDVDDLTQLQVSPLIEYYDQGRKKWIRLVQAEITNIIVLDNYTFEVEFEFIEPYQFKQV